MMFERHSICKILTVRGSTGVAAKSVYLEAVVEIRYRSRLNSTVDGLAADLNLDVGFRRGAPIPTHHQWSL